MLTNVWIEYKRTLLSLNITSTEKLWGLFLTNRWKQTADLSSVWTLTLTHSYIWHKNHCDSSDVDKFDFCVSFCLPRRDPWPVRRRRDGEHHWQHEARGPRSRFDGYKGKLLEILHRPCSPTAQGEPVWQTSTGQGAVCFSLLWISPLIIQRKLFSEAFLRGDVCH